MLQNLSEEIRERVRLAEECKRSSKTALTPSPIKACLDLEQRWLNIARRLQKACRGSRVLSGKDNGR